MRPHDHADHDLGTAGLSLFDVPASAIVGMVRGSSSVESQSAAVDVLPVRRALQERVYAILKSEGPLTDRELEDRPEFGQYGPSSVRKRRGELLQAGRVHQVGRRDRMATWGVV